ncbi:MAG: shikimate kinase [Clostridiaceae bacterium]|nr:shikimate kinase [Clostridiaceae bacterium]
MKLVFLIGNAAVGKMTVGQELCGLTGLRLFHNHMAIEPVLEIFGKFYGPAIKGIREIIFEEFAKTDAYGLVFTYMWAFDLQSDWDYVEHVRGIFKKHHPDAEVIYVELIASQEVRLVRNTTENRLKQKASKRDIESSTKRLIEDDKSYRCVSNEGEVPFENYMRIDNSALTARDAAVMIKERFGL